jgi:hypothetical protein
MIKIYKGDRVLNVTKAAYDNYYLNSGWQLKKTVENSTEASENIINETVEETVEQPIEHDEWEEAVNETVEVEKPLSEMNRDELTNKAISMGLDISGVTSNKQLRELIKSNM